MNNMKKLWLIVHLLAALTPLFQSGNTLFQRSGRIALGLRLNGGDGRQEQGH